MGGKKPLRRPLWPPTRATASNYYPLGLDGAGGAAKPLLRAPKKPAPLHGRLPAFSGAVDAFERARKCFLEWRYFFSIILSEFLKNRVALHGDSRCYHCWAEGITYIVLKHKDRACTSLFRANYWVQISVEQGATPDCLPPHSHDLLNISKLETGWAPKSPPCFRRNFPICFLFSVLFVPDTPHTGSHRWPAANRPTGISPLRGSLRAAPIA